MRGGGGTEESDEFASPVGKSGSEISPAKSSPPSSQKQYGLAKFFGSKQEQEEAQPVNLLKTNYLTPRKRHSRVVEDMLRQRNEAIQEAARLEAENAENEEELIEAALKKKRRLVQRNRDKTEPTSEEKPKSNRRLPGSEQKRVEISVAVKAKYAKELQDAISEFSRMRDFWPAMEARYRLPRRTLRDILSKADQWETLKAQPKLRTIRKRQVKIRTRAQGAGRKVPFSEVISDMKQWLSIERACGHTLSKQDLLDEYLARLQSSANRLVSRAQDPSLSKLQKAELLAEAGARTERKFKINKSQAYRKVTKESLIKWLGAKYMSTELVTNISKEEARIRNLLAWQQFDYSLWLSCCASEKTLEDSQEVSRVKDFITARPNLVIGFSDQVPLWAKATGRKAIFSEEEIHNPSDVKDFCEVREAIKQVMHSDSKPETLMSALPKKSSGSSALIGSAEVKRKLSFSSAEEPQSSNPESRVVPADEETLEPSAPEASAKEPQKAAIEIGSKTLLGISGEDRFRITYEARQLLYSVYADPTQPIQGSVGKGLLVVPGQWARLSNISSSGTWLSNESFSVGDKTVHRKAGENVGRILLPYRRLREEHPQLFSKVDIMSQPASNVDSVILKWVIEAQAKEYPASLWQRDCFCSVFSESSQEAMFLANQVSCLVAEKCTSKLQITDADFSKQFKSLVRNKLQELRSEWQGSDKKDHSVWKVGPLQIVQSVVHAQDFMYQKNLRDSWVLKAAVRNGILAYRPNPQTNKLEKLLSQDWIAQEDIGFGSKRYPPEWLKDRYKWLDTEGRPQKPDWNLSNAAKEISDLQVWDYYNTCGSSGSEPEDGPEISGELAQDLELELQNSLSLTLSPKLRRAGLRRLASAKYQAPEAKAKQAKIRTMRKNRKEWRTKLRGKFVQNLKDSLKGKKSREEALENLTPQAKPKASAKHQKFSVAFKSNLKTKPSAKSKLSIVKKCVKKSKQKSAMKAIAEAQAGSMAEKKAQLQEAAPPLPPPPGPPESDSDSEDPWPNKKVVVTSELAGSLAYAKKGTLMSKKNKKSQRYMLFTNSGNYPVKAEWLEVNTKPDQNQIPFPKWTQLSRADLSLMLTHLNANPLNLLGINPSEWDCHEVLKVTQEITELEDQRIFVGWLLLRWKLSKSVQRVVPEDIGFNCLDPVIAYSLSHWEEQGKDGELRLSAIHSHLQGAMGEKTYSPHHWTLLVAQRFEGGIRWRRYDSLSKEHEESHEAQKKLGTLIDPEFKLPPLSNSAKQPVSSNACGFYVLHYMELELKLFLGEWPEHWPQEGWSQWKKRLITFTQKLLAEQAALSEKASGDHARMISAQENEKKQLEKAREKQSKLSDIASHSYLQAEALIRLHGERFTWKELPQETLIGILSLEVSPGVCSKCRWTSGCYSCSAWKAFRYHLHKEAQAKKKLHFKVCEIGLSESQFNSLFKIHQINSYIN